MPRNGWRLAGQSRLRPRRHRGIASSELAMPRSTPQPNRRGIASGTNPPEWLNLDRMRHLRQRQPGCSTLLRRRTYASIAGGLHGYVEPAFWLAAPVPLLAVDRDGPSFRNRPPWSKLASNALNWPPSIGVDTSLLSKILRGIRKCPDNLADTRNIGCFVAVNWRPHSTAAVPRPADQTTDACFHAHAVSDCQRG